VKSPSERRDERRSPATEPGGRSRFGQATLSDECVYRLRSQRAFEEDEFVGRTLRIGTKTVIAVVDHDPRCKMMTLDPDTAEDYPEVMRCVARTHNGTARVYAAVGAGVLRLIWTERDSAAQAAFDVGHDRLNGY
jgi:hypothetical protein